ncbi:MAG: hypothetical protein HYT80_00870 [Euryarchaeota archaeon]|nr:hypothetical protein [Euryarchaeota archaeon]
MIVFSVSFYYVVDVAVRTQGDTTGTDESRLTKNAESLANVLTARGSGWFASDACVAGIEQTVTGDGVDEGRFGLGSETCDAGGGADSQIGRLDYYKIKNLYTAAKAEDPDNTFLDYDEAHESLGLVGQNLDFHIRSWPVLASVRTVLERGYGDANLKPGYIGNYVPTASAPARPDITHAARVDDLGDDAEIKVTITNPATGSVGSAFMVSLSVDLADGAITWNQNTPILPADGTSYNITTKIPQTSDWNWGGKAKKVTYSIQDSIGPLPGADGTGFADFVDPDTGVPVDMASYGSARTIVVVNVDRLSYEVNDPSPPAFGGSNQWPTAVYQGFKGDGDADNQFRPHQSGGYSLYVAGGALAETYTSLGANSERLNQGSYTAAVYTVQIKQGGTVLNDDVMEIQAAGGSCNVGAGTYEPAAAVTTEAGYMERLFDNFDKEVVDSRYQTVGIPYNVTADIYPDVKCSLDSTLPAKLVGGDGLGTLDYYSTLIVGSDVAHNALTSDSVKGSIEKWVTAGGTLVVFGSDAQAVQWLQPLFHAALESGSGGLFVPDEEHPVLKTPNDLDWDSFNEDSEWSYNSGADEKFTHVVKTDDDENDVLGLSNPGSLGKGRVVLSGWRPYALTDDMGASCPPPENMTGDDQCQAIFLIHNLVTISFRELYLDYGPPIPVGQPTGQQSRVLSVYHPDLEQTVTLRVQVFAFPGPK